MRCENTKVLNLLSVHAVLSQQLKSQQCRMPFIHMVLSHLKGKLLEKLHPANAQNNLLLKPVPLVPAVKVIRDFTVFRRIAFHVGVQEEYRDHSAGGTLIFVQPSLNFYLSPFNLHRCGFGHEKQGFCRIPFVRKLLLFSAFSKLLPEVSFPACQR